MRPQQVCLNNPALNMLKSLQIESRSRDFTHICCLPSSGPMINYQFMYNSKFKPLDIQLGRQYRYKLNKHLHFGQVLKILALALPILIFTLHFTALSDSQMWCEFNDMTCYQKFNEFVTWTPFQRKCWCLQGIQKKPAIRRINCVL